MTDTHFSPWFLGWTKTTKEKSDVQTEEVLEQACNDEIVEQEKREDTTLAAITNPLNGYFQLVRYRKDLEQACFEDIDMYNAHCIKKCSAIAI